MLTKILITVVIIIALGLFFKARTAERASAIQAAEAARKARKAKEAKKAKEEKESPASGEQPGSLSVHTVAYLIVGVLIATSAAIFLFNYQSDNRIVTIRVTDKDGSSTEYQARQKEIKGRQFRTLDNKLITLGESDRIEMEGE